MNPSARLDRRRLAAAALLVTTLAVAALGAASRWERARTRRLALPFGAEAPAAAPAAPLGEAPCAAEELARAGAPVTALLLASDGTLWIGTRGRGVLREGEPGFAPEPIAALSGRELDVNALAEHDGLVWAATRGGLVALDDGRRALALLDGEPVAALAAARGALYAATARGLHRVGVGGGAERVEVAGPSGEPLRPAALAVSGGRLWLGTDAGAYALPLAALAAPLLARTARWHPLVLGDPPADTNVVTALAPLGDGVVAGTDDGGLVLVGAGGRVAASRFDDARANEVAAGAAALAPDGAVVAGTRGGVLVARPGPAGLEVVRAAGLGPVEATAVAPAGALVGTSAGAVLRIACGGVPAS